MKRLRFDWRPCKYMVVGGVVWLCQLGWTATFELVNGSDTDIQTVEAGPTYIDDWGANLLEGSLIPPGDRRVFDVPSQPLDCLFDIRVQSSTGFLETYMDVDFCEEGNRITFEGGDHQEGRDIVDAVTATLEPVGSNEAANQSVVLSSMEVGATFRDCTDWGCPWMVVVDGGGFERGSWERDDETPVTRVTVPGPFAVGQFEVSVAQFEEFARDTGYDDGGTCYVKQHGRWQWVEGASWRRPGFQQDDSHPVVCVTWNTAVAYAMWLAERTGAPYRLLTEAEAEFLARASAMNFERSGRANCKDCGSDWDGKGTSPVGRLRPDRLGLSGVFGNAAEWVQDCYQSGYSNAPRDGSAWLSESCESHVVRGGSWDTRARQLRASGRDHVDTVRRHSGVGFRVARGPQRLR